MAQFGYTGDGRFVVVNDDGSMRPATAQEFAYYQSSLMQGQQPQDIKPLEQVAGVVTQGAGVGAGMSAGSNLFGGAPKEVVTQAAQNIGQTAGPNAALEYAGQAGLFGQGGAPAAIDAQAGLDLAGIPTTTNLATTPGYSGLTATGQAIGPTLETLEAGANFGLGTGLNAVAPYAAAPLAAYTAYKAATAVPKLFGEEKLDFGEQAAWALPTGGASFLINPAKKLFGSGKGPDQRARDSFRNQFRKVGLMEGENWLLPGGERVSERGLGLKGKSYNVDFGQPGIGSVVGVTDPLAEILARGNAKKRSDVSGILANVASKSSDPNAAVRSFYEKEGYDRDKAYTEVGKLQEAGKLDQGRADAYRASIDRLYGVKPKR